MTPYFLTENGLWAATSLIRSHLLWGTYLCGIVGFCDAEAHYAAHRLEHVTDAQMQEQLQNACNYPARDPHQNPIP